jgi:hypothetical protein
MMISVLMAIMMVSSKCLNGWRGGTFVGIRSTKILNKDTLLYHEDAGHFSGYFGYTRPFTNTIYGDFEFVEALATNGNCPLDVDLDVRWKFDGSSWKLTPERY